LRRGATIIVAVFFASALFLPAYCYGISASFLYKLSDNNGTIPFDSVKVSADRWHHELYVIDGGDSSVRIFNETGMEVYRINDDGSLGSIADGVVDKEGNFIALAYKGQEYSVIRCNYRGEFLASLALKNIPGAFQAGFYPTALAYREGHLYLADKVSMKVLVTDEEGLFEQGIDLFDVLGFTKNAKKKKGDIDMSGFSVDREGDILFTVPVEFCAYKLSPGGNISSFCQRGGGPGRFNIASGIASDDNGYIYVSDKLKSAVLIFDKDFSFLHQIGHRGIGPGGLIVPMDMAVLGDKLYVTQSAGQGVSVFSIGH
jgi:DNA-binding beta-propeller fold protein YncE